MIKDFDMKFDEGMREETGDDSMLGWPLEKRRPVEKGRPTDL